MKETVLTVCNLTKTYRTQTALDCVNLTCKKGEIYGLIGKNGAGKTTMLRLISGQSFADSGEISLFSETTSKGLNSARKRCGVMIETPSFYPYLTAAQNLEYYRIQRGIAAKDCVSKLLQEVELTQTGNKKFKDFSLGMKQRLGLALALMNHPDLLLLDEPVNGLDPMGIVNFRNLLLRLQKEKNMTIMISSHILSEMESLATTYGFLDHGTLLEEITAEELNRRCRKYMEISVDDSKHAAVILEKELDCTDFEVLPENIIHIYAHLDSPGNVSSALVKNGVILNSIETKGAKLEDYFIHLVESKREA